MPDDELRTLLKDAMPPDELRRLSAIAPWPATLAVAKTWGLTLGLFAIAGAAPHPLVWLAVGVALAAQQHALAILAHDAAHHRLYASRRLNDAVGTLCAMPVGVSLLAYRHVHTQHHRHLYTEKDPDMALMAGYPRGRGYLLRKLAQDLVGLTTIKNVQYLTGGGKRAPRSPGEGGPGPEVKRDKLRTAGFHVGLLVLAAVTGQWAAYALWMVPLLTVYQVLLRMRALCEHGAPMATDSPLRAARTTLAGPLARFFLFPHGVQHHIEHHLFPSIPHYRLAEAHRLLAASGVLEQADVSPGLPATWRKVYAPRSTAPTATP